MGLRKLFRTSKAKADIHQQRQPRQRPAQRSESSRSVDSVCSCSSTSSLISFSETVEVQVIPPLSALTDRPEELWYQQEEYSEIRTRIRQLAKYADRCEKNETQTKKKVCTRGLESMMEGMSTEQLKLEALVCVLHAQRMRLDEEGMATVYKRVSQDSATLARERASNDAKAIELYLSR